jgi:hypothetical protein
VLLRPCCIRYGHGLDLNKDGFVITAGSPHFLPPPRNCSTGIAQLAPQWRRCVVLCSDGFQVVLSCRRRLSALAVWAPNLRFVLLHNFFLRIRNSFEIIPCTCKKVFQPIFFELHNTSEALTTHANSSLLIHARKPYP